MVDLTHRWSGFIQKRSDLLKCLLQEALTVILLTAFLKALSKEGSIPQLVSALLPPGEYVLRLFQQPLVDFARFKHNSVDFPQFELWSPLQLLLRLEPPLFSLAD